MSRLLPAATTLVLGLLFVPAAGAADEQTPLNLDGDASAPAQAAGGGGLVRTIVGLAIVIGVIYGIAWILKQVKGSREPVATGVTMTSLGHLPLGPGRGLHLVRAGRGVVLVGAAGDSVVVVRTWTEGEPRADGLIDGAVATEPIAGLPTPAPVTAGTVIQRLRDRTVIR